MKKLYLIPLLLLLFTNLLGQDKKEEVNFIIVIDDEVWINYTALEIQIKDLNGLIVDKVSGLYYPGNLSFQKGDYEKLINIGNGSMSLAFSYKEYEGKKEQNYKYELPFSKKWLNYYFVVIKIYNLNNRRYRGVFEPLSEEKNYTYELDSPDGSMRRVRHSKKIRP